MDTVRRNDSEERNLGRCADCNATVVMEEDPRLMMPSSRKGRGQKKVTHVPVPIPISVAEKPERASKGKAIDDPLLTKPSGERWKQSDHSRLFRRAVVGATLDPGEVTLYALRHSSIVRDLLANVPVRICRD